MQSMIYTSISVGSYSTYYNQYIYTNVYPNITAMSNPKASTWLSNAIADVMSLPHSAVSINTFNSFGNIGGGNVGGYSNPRTTATLTVLNQGTGLSTSDLFNTFTAAINAFRNGFNSQGSNQSPLGIALASYGFPNTNNVYSISVATISLSSYGTPTVSPSSIRPSVVNLSPTMPPVQLKFTGAPSSVIPSLNADGFQLPSLGTLVSCIMTPVYRNVMLSIFLFYLS